MSFNIGDVVYCIDPYLTFSDNTSQKMYALDYDIPYVIERVFTYEIVIKPSHQVYNNERFITKEEYFLRIRSEKIKKLKSLIDVQKEEVR